MMDKDTDRMVKFIQDTQAWLTDHVTKSCLLPLKTYFAKESPDRVRHGLRLVWEDITKVFQVIIIHCMSFFTVFICFMLECCKECNT